MTSKFAYKSLTCLVTGAIGGFIGFLLTLIIDLLSANKGIPSDGFDRGDWITVIVMAVLVPLFLSRLVYIMFFQDLRAEAIERRGASCARFTNTIKVERRGRYLKSILRVRRAKITNYQYVNPKSVYTGATVGGVSMGGFHVEQGGYSSQVLQTDTYQLVCEDPKSDEKHPVEWIELSEDCLIEAKKDPQISKYVFHNSLCLTGAKVTGSTWTKLTKDGVLSQNLEQATYGAQLETLAKYELTYAELLYIKHWLCKEK